jgi:hypothetical protein
MNGEDVNQSLNDNKPIITLKGEGSTNNEWKEERRIPMRRMTKPSLPPHCIAEFPKVSGPDVQRKSHAERMCTVNRQSDRSGISPAF